MKLAAELLVELVTDDFLSLQVKETSGSVTVEGETIFSVTKLEGAKGDTGATGSGSNVTVKDEGTSVTGTPHSALNFTGTGVTVTDEGSGQAKIDIPGNSVLMTEHQEEESDGESTTTGSIPITKLTLTTPTVPAGNYRLGWYYEIENSSTSGEVTATVENITDSLQYAFTDISPHNTDNNHGFGGIKYVTFATSSSKTFEVQFFNIDSGTAEIRNTRMEFWRVS